MTVRKEEETRQSSKLEFADKVEGLVNGIVHFASSFLLTVWHLGFRQALFVQKYMSDSKIYLKPLSMLILMAFLATKTVRILAVSILFGIASFLRSCESETMLDIEEPEILRNPLTLPSVEEVVFVSIPLFLGVAFLAHALRWVLFGAANGAHALSKDITFYAVSFSLACCTIAAAFPVVVTALPEHLEQQLPILPSGFIELILVLLIFFWPSFVYYRLIASSSLFSMLRPRLVITKRILLAVAALLLVCTTILIALAVTYPYVISDLKPLDAKKPVLGVQLISHTSEGFFLLLANNSNEDLWILSERIRFAGENNPGLLVQNKLAERNRPLFLLKAQSAMPMLLTPRPRTEEEMIVIPFDIEPDSVAIDVLTHSGKRQTLYSIIRVDADPVPIERLVQSKNLDIHAKKPGHPQ